MATSNILWQTHEQFLKNMEERIQTDGITLQIQRIMHDYISQKRKITWTINLEKIFILYVNVSVILEKTDPIKDALQQYKYLTQVQYANSLENVLVHIKNEVEKLFSRKVSQYDIEEVKQIPDIDSEDPEDTNLMLSNLNIGQKQKEIQIKSVLKIIYEMYKMIIETVKVHKKLEEVHITTVQKMLEFCDKYSRKNELKRFLEYNHFFLTQLQGRDIDFSKNPNHISLYNSETRDYLIQIRLDCTRYAIKHGLYSYAFRQLEDISILINLKKVSAAIKQKTMSTYYLYLSEVFWSSKYYTYHSFFFLHHLLVFKTNPQASPEEIKEKVNQLILGVLSIPQNPIEDTQSEEQKTKIAALQRNNNKLIPKKDEIISLIQRMNLNEIALEEVNQLFNFEFNEVSIFNVASRIQPIFNSLKENSKLALYLPFIEENIIYKLLSNISKIYKTLNLENFYKFFTFSSKQKCDQCLIYASTQGQISCRIDQSKGVIYFNLSKKNEYLNASQNLICLALQAKFIKNNIYNVPTDNAALQKSAQMFLNESKDIIKKRFEDIVNYKRSEQARISNQQNRQDLEEKNKEELQKLIQIEEHNKKIEEYETRKKVEKQILKQKMELRNEIIKIKGNQIVKIEGIKIENMTEEDFVSIELNTLIDLKKNVQNKIKEEQENKYKKAFVRLDYINREIKKAEFEKLQGSFNPSSEQILQFVENAKQKHEKNLQQKNSFLPIKSFKDTFFAAKLEEKKKQYNEELTQFKLQIEREFKQKILAEAEKALQEELAEIEKQKEAQKNKPIEEPQEPKAETGWRIVQKANEDRPQPPVEKPLQKQEPAQQQSLAWRQNLPNQEEKPKQKPEQATSGVGMRNIVTNQKSDTNNQWRTDNVQPTQPIQRTVNPPVADTNAPRRFVGGNQESMVRRPPAGNQPQQKPPTTDNTGGGFFSRNKDSNQGPAIQRNTNQKK